MNRKGFAVIEIFIIVSVLTLFAAFFSTNRGSDQNQQVVCEDNVIRR